MMLTEAAPAPAPKPHITALSATVDRALLQCEAEGASDVEWKDGAGNVLPVEQHVSERGGRHYVTILTTVTRTDHYRCEVTQREINHQISAETHVFISGETSVFGLYSSTHFNISSDINFKDVFGHTLSFTITFCDVFQETHPAKRSLGCCLVDSF